MNKNHIFLKRPIWFNRLVKASDYSDSSDLSLMDEEHDLLGIIRTDPVLLADLENKVGRIGRFIKSGANGSVYEVSDSSQVLKLTIDWEEVKSANILLNDKMDEAVTVYGVWELPEIADKDDFIVQVWAILMEKLVPMGQRESAFIREFQDFHSSMGFTTERVELFADRYKRKFKPHLFEWLRKAADHLEERSIINRDLHRHNVMMRRNGQMAIIDMGGGSESPESTVRKLAAMLVMAANIIEAYTFPIRESHSKERLRKSGGYSQLVKVSAKGLKNAFELTNEDKLVWSKAKLDSLRETLNEGVHFDDYPRVYINQHRGFGGVGFENGRHRVGLAAEMGLDIQVAVQPDSELWMEYLADWGLDQSVKPSRAAWQQAFKTIRHNGSGSPESIKTILLDLFPAPENS